MGCALLLRMSPPPGSPINLLPPVLVPVTPRMRCGFSVRPSRPRENCTARSPHGPGARSFPHRTDGLEHRAPRGARALLSVRAPPPSPARQGTEAVRAGFALCFVRCCGLGT